MALSLFRRILRKTTRVASHLVGRTVDALRPSYSFSAQHAHFSVQVLGITLTPDLALANVVPFEVLEHYLVHRFDLLGSGWTKVVHGKTCRGLEGFTFAKQPQVVADEHGRWLSRRINRANLAYSESVWRLIRGRYVPIDWQLDIKSGFRWSEQSWFQDIAIGNDPGADVIVPWELAKMHHLPQLAIAFCASHSAGWRGPSREVLQAEFRNQVIDFIANNPPRYGVNWIASNDVAVRVANWLLAFDLLVSSGATFDQEFERVLTAAVVDHGIFIWENVGRPREHSNNHYLTSLVGLLFISAYLPDCPHRDQWQLHAQTEFLRELERQFLTDGGNFEGSTCYHSLSAQVFAHGLALINRQDANKDDWNRSASLVENLERCYGIASLVVESTKPNGQVIQFGDNGSSFLFKLRPRFEKISVLEAIRRYQNLEGYSELPKSAPYFDEQILDHRHVVGSLSGLLSNKSLSTFIGDCVLDQLIVANVAGVSSPLPEFLDTNPTVPTDSPNPDTIEVAWSNLETKGEIQIRTIGIPPDSFQGKVQARSFPSFGLYVYRNVRYYLAIKCGQIGQGGRGGHDHNDQLSIELQIDRMDMIRDPGSYLYTPLVYRRNEYRSLMAHSGPTQMGEEETGGFSDGLFALTEACPGQCIVFSHNCFIGAFKWKGRTIARRIDLYADKIVVRDLGAIAPIKLDSEDSRVPFTSGYGRILR